jgi:hypothetical protein
MERCPACRARLSHADICARCGGDFSISRRAERQAQQLVRKAVRELSMRHLEEASTAANLAIHLANPMLARVISKVILRRELVGAPLDKLPII